MDNKIKLVIILLIILTVNKIYALEHIYSYPSYGISYNYQKTNTSINNTLAANNIPKLKPSLQSVSISYFYYLKPYDLSEIKDSSKINTITKINFYLGNHTVLGLSYTSAPHDEYFNSNYSLKYYFDNLAFYGGWHFPLNRSININFLIGLHYTHQNLIFRSQNEAELNEIINEKFDSWDLNANNLRESIVLGFDYGLNNFTLGILSEFFFNVSKYSSTNGLIISDLPSNYLNGLIIKFQLTFSLPNKIIIH